nr:ion channel [Caloranaerobacter azorensis]
MKNRFCSNYQRVVKEVVKITNFNIYIKKLHISLKTTKVYKAILLVIFFIVINSVLFYLVENNENPNINSLWDALWWGFVTSTTVGYGDIYPRTKLGRIIAIFLMIMGIGFFGFFTASIASVFVERNLRKGMGLLDIDFNGHIVIFGWNYQAKSIIEELLREDKKQKIVLVANISHNPYDNNSVYYIKGDPTTDNVLERANIKYAKSAIVLADRSLENSEMIDARSVLICLAINKINPNIYLVSEVIEQKNVIHFKRANVDETIISTQFESKIMMRCALYKGVSRAIKELLTNSYGNEIYEIALDKKYIGNTYEKIAIEFLNREATLIGIYRDNKVFLNPSKNTILKSKDILIYIAKDKILL